MCAITVKERYVGKRLEEKEYEHYESYAVLVRLWRRSSFILISVLTVRFYFLYDVLLMTKNHLQVCKFFPLFLLSNCGFQRTVLVFQSTCTLSLSPVFTGRMLFIQGAWPEELPNMRYSQFAQFKT